MKVKVNHSQVEALYELFTDLMTLANKGVSFSSMEARLCFLLLHSIYEKLHRLKVPVGGKLKPKYTLALTEVEALSLFLFFQSYQIPERHAYADMTIQAISEHIDRHYV